MIFTITVIIKVCELQQVSTYIRRIKKHADGSRFSGWHMGETVYFWHTHADCRLTCTTPQTTTTKTILFIRNSLHTPC